MSIKHNPAPNATLYVTADYSRFTVPGANRGLNPAKHANLKNSMLKYGFLPCCPLAVMERGGKLIAKAGQHRLAIAEELGLPVYYVIVQQDFDLAEEAATNVPWSHGDYLHYHERGGNDAYRILMEFCGRHDLTVSVG